LFHFSSEVLRKSCPLPKSMSLSSAIKASKIEPLSAFLKQRKKHIEYSEMEQLIEMIGRQLHHLEVNQNKGISTFKIDDITVFHAADDAVYFAITNDDNIYDIDEENQMEITTPVSSTTKHDKTFHSPEYTEFISKKTIPYKIHFKSGYYSFGLLCLYCYVTRTPVAATADDFETLFEPIINTKIYWFMKQVLQEDPMTRRYICV
jgi:hypothetical protein